MGKKRPSNTKSKNDERLEFTQDFIPVKDIRHGIIETTDHRYIKILEIEPINFMLRSDEEQFGIISSFASWLKISPMRLQFKSITRKADSDRHINMVRQELAQEDNPACKRQGEEYIRFIKEIGSREALTRRFFLIFQYEEIRKGDSSDYAQVLGTMQTVEQNARTYFMQCGNTIVQPPDPDEAAAEILYQFFNRRSCVDEPFTSRVDRVVLDTMAAKKLVLGVDPVPHIRMAHFIAPRGIDLRHSGYVVMDGLYYAFLYIKANGYPGRVRGGWMSSLVNAGEGVDIDVFLKRENRSKPAGDLPPQTGTGSAPSGDQKQGQSSLRQPAAPNPSQSGRSRPARRNVPRAVVTIDDRPTVETDADKTRSDLLDLVESQKSGRILTGTIQGIEQLPNNPDHSVAVIYYGDFKVVIPVEEAVELPANFSGSNGDTVRQLMLSKRLGAEVDYIVKGLDQDAGVAVASRLEAMRAKRRQYYLGTDRDGNYRICEGICAEARVVSSIRAGIFVDLFGLEVFIPIRELSYQRLLDASTQFQPGQRILVKILRVDRTDRDHLKVSASVKQASANPYERALQKYTVGNKYVGSVSMVDATGVFVALDGGIDCLCSYPKRGRPPRGARVTVRILGINHETNRIWGAITHVALAR